MTDIKALLDSLMQGGGDLGAKAKDSWDGQSVGAKGAIAGGLLGVLMGGRGGLGGVARVGGAALIGSLASRAYADYKAGKSPVDAITSALGLPDMSPAAASDGLAGNLLRAMIAAAKADGRISDDERARITAQVTTLGLDGEALALINDELAATLDVARIAAFATSDEEATQIYTASLLAVDPGGAAETSYLAALAAQLKLDPQLVQQLHAHSANLMLRA